MVNHSHKLQELHEKPLLRNDNPLCITDFCLKNWEIEASIKIRQNKTLETTIQYRLPAL